MRWMARPRVVSPMKDPWPAVSVLYCSGLPDCHGDESGESGWTTHAVNSRLRRVDAASACAKGLRDDSQPRIRCRNLWSRIRERETRSSHMTAETWPECVSRGRMGVETHSPMGRMAG